MLKAYRNYKFCYAFSCSSIAQLSVKEKRKLFKVVKKRCSREGRLFIGEVVNFAWVGKNRGEASVSGQGE
jgi:hypothetical protein